MKKTTLALFAVVSLKAHAVSVPTIDMSDICTRFFQGDPAAIASYNALKDGTTGIDPVKTCADFAASGEVEAFSAGSPGSTARSFMAQIADVSPDRVRVEVQSESKQSAIAVATASGKVCTFDLAPAPAGVQGGWLVASMDCKRSAGGGFPVMDLNAIENAKRADSK